jgi:4-hydroxy-tetrahydrodipicolinate reductase
VDTIEIKHTARGREGFASGAIMAVEFIENKTGFYNINDLMENIVGGNTY